MPLMTKAKKITTAAKSSPATIFILMARRRVEQSVCEVDGEDRIWRTAISNTERR
jgi:hypothetical protein